MTMFDESLDWGVVWERSCEVSAPRYVWSDWLKEICRAFAGTTDEEMAKWPPPTEEITLAGLCQLAFGPK